MFVEEVIVWVEVIGYLTSSFKHQSCLSHEHARLHRIHFVDNMTVQ